MTDLSKWQEPVFSSNKIPYATYTLLRTIICNDNILRKTIGGVKSGTFAFYRYDFENDEDIILSESGE